MSGENMNNVENSMDKPMVSVLMTTYNAGTYLRESVGSVFRQTYGYDRLQFIIVDDASDDHSCDFLLEDPFYRDHVEYFRLPENENISCATNFGISKVRGEYLAIIDSDDIWYDDKLEKQIGYLKSHPEYQACFTWVHLIDENGEDAEERIPQIKSLFEAHTRTQEEWLRTFFFEGNHLNNPSSVVTMDACRAVGEHDPAYIQGQDFNWWTRFTKYFSFCILEEPLIHYRRFLNGGRSNISRSDEARDTRFYNEFMHLRYHFFDDMPEEIFLKAFRHFFKNQDASAPLELEYEKAMLITKKYNISQRIAAAGITRLDALLHNPDWNRDDVQYKKALSDYRELSGHRIYNDPFMDKEAALLENEIKEAEARRKTAAERRLAAESGLESIRVPALKNAGEKIALDKQTADLEKLLLAEKKRNDLKNNLLRFYRKKRGGVQ